MPIEPGQTLSHYCLMSKIGAGGMGEVYLAEDTTLKRKVALKVLPDSMANDPARLERFQREAEAIAALNHPNIVTIYTVEEHEGVRFLTMELVEGDSLDRKVTPGGLVLSEVLDIGTAVADALAAAHDKGIVHRDLKPANVMMTKDGRVKVLDFGLAKLAAGPEPDSVTEAATRHASLTGEGTVIGTVPYMSPEQLSDKDVDHRTDIFSLGVMLYELSVGRRPFVGDSAAELTSSIMRDVPRPVNEIRENVPRHLGRIIGHCLEKDREARFQTAKDIRNELRGLRKELESVMAGQSRAMGAVSVPSPAASAPVSTPPVSGVAAGAGGAKYWLRAVGGTVVVLVVVAVAWLAGRKGSEPGATGELSTHAAAPVGGGATVTETDSLAVLPFTNMSSDKEQEYFSDGLTEELLNALVKVPELKVTGRTSSFSFKGKNEDLRTIARKLGVANILEGSVRKSGNKIRITAQLVKAEDGFHLWSETYDRTLDDIFAVQDDIAKAVAAELKVTLLGKGADAPRPDAEAYDLVLQAHFVIRSRTDEKILQAKRLLERALQISPAYAPAWAEMGLVHMKEAEVSTVVEARRQAGERARQALTRALELDPNLAVAHSRMAGIQRDSWEFALAERSTARALAADPKNSMVVVNGALMYASLGRADDAIALEQRGLMADPLNISALNNLAIQYLLAGRLEEAEALWRKALELAPDYPSAYNGLADIHLMRGEVNAARESYAKFTELTGQGDYGRLMYESMVEHTGGNPSASQAAAGEFDKRFGAADPATAAKIHAWRGEADAAFAWLDKALAARDPYLSLIKLDIYLRSLRTDPRWNDLLKKIGLPTD